MFIRSKDSNTPGAYDLGELDQALFLYLDGQDHHPSNVQDHIERRNLSLTLSTLLILLLSFSTYIMINLNEKYVTIREKLYIIFAFSL